MLEGDVTGSPVNTFLSKIISLSQHSSVVRDSLLCFSHNLNLSIHPRLKEKGSSG